MKTKTLELTAIIFTIIALLISPLLVITPSATESTLKMNDETSNYQSKYATTDGQVDTDATFDELEARAETKFDQLIRLCQTIGKPICVICFIISVLVAIFGAIGRGGATKGVVGAFLSAGAYVCINYAFEIVLFFQSFMVS